MYRFNKFVVRFCQAVQVKEGYGRAKLQQIISDCNLINAMSFEQREAVCRVFYENFFPIAENHRRIVAKLNKVDSKDPEALYTHMINVIDFLDQGAFGFLTGDIDAHLLELVESELQSLMDRGLYDREEVHSQLKKTIFKAGRQFKLPKWGVHNTDQENPRNLFERQLILEEESNDLAIEKFREVFAELQKLSRAQNLQAAQRCMGEWFPTLCREIQKEQEACIIDNKSVADRSVYGQYLVSMKSERLAVIALNELLRELINASVRYHQEEERSIAKRLEGNQISLIQLTKEIAKQVNKQYVYEKEELLLRQRQKERSKEVPTKPVNLAKQNKYEENRLKQQVQSHYYKNKVHDIPVDVQLKLAQLLIFIIKETVRVSNVNGIMVPLLIHTQKMYNNKAYSILNVNEGFLQHMILELQKSDAAFLHLDRSLPMIYPPAPWEDPEVGGYYLRPTNLIRQTSTPSVAAKCADLTDLYHVVDTISRVPWQINVKVLNVMDQVWALGGGVAEIPSKFEDEVVHDFQVKEAKTREERIALLRKQQQLRDGHSMRCDFSLKLSVAHAFSGINKIYFPHNLDFRGRLYPVPPHLNHMGGDVSRGLLQFAKAKPLGERGFYWLKVHLANKMGKDKLPLSERINYVHQNMDLILRCAKDPIQNREWQEFECAWQTLATMLDFAQALKNKDPFKYVSRLHVHQDGSCNGLQHYAALGRDIEGATQVNLADTDKPGDVYSHVAGMVERRVDQDAADSSSQYHILAGKLQGHIKRKLVKQTVMTSVYGVTFVGAREQIHRQLKDRGLLDEDESMQYSASFYLARITLDAIKDLFEGAHMIKQWLIECAHLIGQHGEPVSWITPLGLPVIQPYRSKTQHDYVQTVMQKIEIVQNARDLPVLRTKQKSAFPPNFIHSLDSTHLMYTALECEKEYVFRHDTRDITFAAVHDSYWTHPCDVDRLNQLLRDQFVRLHSQPLLEELLASFIRRFPSIEFPPIPQRGKFDLENVKKSVYFFA